MSVLTVTDARAALPALLDRVEQGEQITITRHGRAVAMLVNPDSVRPGPSPEVRARIDAVAQYLDRAKGSPVSGDVTAARADALVGELRAERDSW
ncbi:MAG: type II toxin-antitoxin system prevent-host-death family antitoxin [Bifidobacteriaceae bacterium]|nr:type II toxin-antitoxin system prevent-host-death family antitoxin [Bifidobacteriaceae bacterium]